MRILIVEDDFELSVQLQNGLREQGYSADRATRKDSALEQAVSSRYDILLLDRMLPGGDGLDLLRQLREKGVDSRVIFLSARGDVADRIAGLDAGADDYLVKPFSFPELLARIRAVLRKGVPQPLMPLRVGDLQLDPIERTVRRADIPIELSAKEFAVLQFLMRHAGNVVSRTMILEDVWKMSTGGMANVVDVHITRLRKKIDRDFDKPLIHTRHGLGYVVRAD